MDARRSQAHRRLETAGAIGALLQAPTAVRPDVLGADVERSGSGAREESRDGEQSRGAHGVRQERDGAG